MSAPVHFKGKYGAEIAARIYTWPEIVERVRAGETFFLAGVGPVGDPVFTDSHELCCGYEHGCELGQPVGSFTFPYVTDSLDPRFPHEKRPGRTLDDLSYPAPGDPD